MIIIGEEAFRLEENGFAHISSLCPDSLFQTRVGAHGILVFDSQSITILLDVGFLFLCLQHILIELTEFTLH
jgi:hypothetical protein